MSTRASKRTQGVSYASTCVSDSIPYLPVGALSQALGGAALQRQFLFNTENNARAETPPRAALKYNPFRVSAPDAAGEGDDEDDERDQDSEADSGFVHVQLVLQRFLPSFFLSRPIGLVQTQSDRAENLRNRGTGKRGGGIR